MPEIAKVSYTHADIARWLLQNPDKPLSECAKHFGYTQAWLSCIIHSKAFEAHMAELQSKANEVVVADIPAKLRGVADTALEKLGEQLDEVITEGPAHRVDRDFVRETAEMALKALGYGPAKQQQPQGPQGAPGGNIYVERAVFLQARERALGRTEAAVIELKPVPDGQSV